MSSLNRQDSALPEWVSSKMWYRLQATDIDDSLIRLLVKTKIGNLGQEVVQPATRPRVRMSAGNSNITLVVHRITRSKTRKGIKDSITNCSISHCNVQDSVYEAVVSVRERSEDKGT